MYGIYTPFVFRLPFSDDNGYEHKIPMLHTVVNCRLGSGMPPAVRADRAAGKPTGSR